MHNDLMLEALRANVGAKNPHQVPWPAAYRPRAQVPTTAPSPGDALPKCDALVVTWTSGEAQTLASLLTGGNFGAWHAYQHDVASYIPKVTGTRAPFNDDTAEMRRYYHTLGLYCPFTIGDYNPISCLALKSGLHMAYDGPTVPMVDLWLQLIGEVQPKIVITTGTGGGIGADVQLGDVIVGTAARFHLNGTLKSAPFNGVQYPTSTIDFARMRELITDAILKVNGDLLMAPRTPVVFYPDQTSGAIVSTDTFAFDDSSNHFQLQGLGKCCDMGDATLGLAISKLGASAPRWLAIRNASDPQIKNTSPKTSAGLAEAKKLAEQIYGEYQCITTAGSVIATWAAIVATLGHQHPST